jgi:hypothetical protein
MRFVSSVLYVLMLPKQMLSMAVHFCTVTYSYILRHEPRGFGPSSQRDEAVISHTLCDEFSSQ